MIIELFKKHRIKKTYDEELEEDINNVIFNNETIYWILRKYGRLNKEKIIRYKIIGIKRRLTDIEIIKKDLKELIIN